MKMKISDFLKTIFLNIIFTFIDDFTLNSEYKQRNLKFWTLLAFVGLCWPSLAFLAFVALDEFFKQKLAFADKN